MFLQFSYFTQKHVPRSWKYYVFTLLLLCIGKKKQHKVLILLLATVLHTKKGFDAENKLYYLVTEWCVQNQ